MVVVQWQALWGWLWCSDKPCEDGCGVEWQSCWIWLLVLQFCYMWLHVWQCCWIWRLQGVICLTVLLGLTVTECLTAVGFDCYWVSDSAVGFDCYRVWLLLGLTVSESLTVLLGLTVKSVWQCCWVWLLQSVWQCCWTLWRMGLARLTARSVPWWFYVTCAATLPTSPRFWPMVRPFLTNMTRFLLKQILVGLSLNVAAT